jgi:hypothetical protein
MYKVCFQATIKKMEKSVKVHDPEFAFPFKDEELSIEEIREHFSAATTALAKCQNDAEGHRIQCQYDLLIKYDADDDPTTQEESKRKAKIVRRNIQAEEARSFFCSINHVVKPRTSSGVQKLLVPRKK